MKFQSIIKNIIEPAESPLSRIYGYSRDTKGEIQIVANEAKVIKEVVTALASRKTESVDEIIKNILQEFFLDGVRNRSNKNWTRQSLIGLVRPIYAGIVVSKMGIWRQSKIYPPIVKVDMIKKALKVLKDAKLAQ